MMTRLQPARTGLSMIVLGAVLALASPAAAAPVATLEDFLAICPAVLFDTKTLGEAQKAVGLRKIDNSPLAFGWQTQTFTNKEGDRGVVVTKMKFADGTRDVCAVELTRQLRYEEVEDLRAALEKLPAIGPLDGKVYPYPAGTSNAVLKTPGGNPLVMVSVAAAGGRTQIAVDVWRGSGE